MFGTLLPACQVQCHSTLPMPWERWYNVYTNIKHRYLVYMFVFHNIKQLNKKLYLSVVLERVIKLARAHEYWVSSSKAHQVE